MCAATRPPTTAPSCRSWPASRPPATRISASSRCRNRTNSEAMKAGLTTSVVMHAALLGFGLFSLSAPQRLRGRRCRGACRSISFRSNRSPRSSRATRRRRKEKPAPMPTKKPDIVPDAKKAGDNRVDTDKSRRRKPSRSRSKPRRLPQPSPSPSRSRSTSPSPNRSSSRAEAGAVPATEVTPEPQPKQEVKPDPVGETIVAETPRPRRRSCPTERPRRRPAEAAEGADRQGAGPQGNRKAGKSRRSKPKSEEKEFDADEVAALLNKEKASGGGAKRSTEEARSAATRRPAARSLRRARWMRCAARSQRCWNIPAGARRRRDLRVVGQFKLDRPASWKAARRSIGGGGSPASNAPRPKPRGAPSRAARPIICPPTNTRPGRNVHRQFRSERDVLNDRPPRLYQRGSTA